MISSPILSLFIGLFLVSVPVSAFPAICFGLGQNTVVNTNCSDLRIYFIKENICFSPFQQVDITMKQVKHFWLDIFQNSISLSSIPNEDLLVFLDLYTIISKTCPERQINSARFLEEDNSVSYSLAKTVTWPLDPNLLKEIKFESNAVNFSNEDLFAEFTNFDPSANYHISAAKEYVFSAGEFVPWDPLDAEIALASANPFTHTPNLIELIAYQIGMYLPVSKTQLLHSALGFCLKNDKNNKSNYLMVSRSISHENPFGFRSSILVYNVGESETDECQLNSTNWMENTEDLKKMCKEDNFCIIMRSEKTDQNIPLSNLWDLGNKYLSKFSNFNGLFNCQHFCTNTFDFYFGERLDLLNWELMDVHSYFSMIEPRTYWLDD